MDKKALINSKKILVPSECTNFQTLQLSLKLKYRATNTLQEGLKQGFKRKLLLDAPNRRFLVGEFFRNISVIPQSPTSHFLQNKQRILHSYITSCFQFCVQHRETPGNFPWHKMQLGSLPASELFLCCDIIYIIKPV